MYIIRRSALSMNTRVYARICLYRYHVSLIRHLVNFAKWYYMGYRKHGAYSAEHPLGERNVRNPYIPTGIDPIYMLYDVYIMCAYFCHIYIIIDEMMWPVTFYMHVYIGIYICVRVLYIIPPHCIVISFRVLTADQIGTDGDRCFLFSGDKCCSATRAPFIYMHSIHGRR